jgi:hypothetical protein
VERLDRKYYEQPHFSFRKLLLMLKKLDLPHIHYEFGEVGHYIVVHARSRNGEN